jgi:hypothetical protein
VTAGMRIVVERAFSSVRTNEGDGSGGMSGFRTPRKMEEGQ